MTPIGNHSFGMAHYRSPYETLNVAPDAESIVIEAAHKALIKKYHPDLWLQDPGAQARAAAINEAFAMLKNPEARDACDRRLRAMRNAAQAAAFQPQRPRPRGARWWSGWLVALILAAAQFVPWGEITLPAAQLASRSAPARVAAEAVAEAEVEAQAEEKAMGARGATRPEKPLPASLVKLLDERQEQEAAFLKTLESRSMEASGGGGETKQVGRTRRPPARKGSGQRPDAPADRSEPADFLEREGYIY
ncbi:J domain-containing protein [Sphingosinicella rhizophila]|uniref:J domain-containing protein n=1 Tax=Sphingosinicella rhizophila TaxID=3050082 RepID=A0ABU3Q7E2_9SPHN|nr:J domain-containing protein [Sphingosinicella sp. GR2756]MDT9599029.1 J domain-containing protein [Sphingosinicella sp. GR2756]